MAEEVPVPSFSFKEPISWVGVIGIILVFLLIIYKMFIQNC